MNKVFVTAGDAPDIKNLEPGEPYILYGKMWISGKTKSADSVSLEGHVSLLTRCLSKSEAATQNVAMRDACWQADVIEMEGERVPVVDLDVLLKRSVRRRVWEGVR